MAHVSCQYWIFQNIWPRFSFEAAIFCSHTDPHLSSSLVYGKKDYLIVKSNSIFYIEKCRHQSSKYISSFNMLVLIQCHEKSNCWNFESWLYLTAWWTTAKWFCLSEQQHPGNLPHTWFKLGFVSCQAENEHRLVKLWKATFHKTLHSLSQHGWKTELLILIHPFIIECQHPLSSKAIL